MRIPGTQFSDVDIYSKSYSKAEAYNILTEWSRHAVDIIKAQPHETNSDFYTIITFDLNPTDYKGVDDIKVEIWRSSRDGKPEKNLFMISNHCHTMSACLDQLNAELAKIKERTDNPDIIEMNGKKYRLTEVK